VTAGGPSSDPLEPAIAARARRSGIDLTPARARALAAHARLLLAHNAVLHLTTITAPDEIVERHIGEAFEGAALLPATISGTLVDLGSGNGYPGIPLALARPGLLPSGRARRRGPRSRPRDRRQRAARERSDRLR